LSFSLFNIRGGSNQFQFSSYDLLPADLDGDGDIDILTSAENSDKIAWYENLDGHGTLWSTRIVAYVSEPTAVAVGDLDGDHDPDVLTVSNDDYRLTWYENMDGAGSFGPARVLATDAFWNVFAVDADGDGDTDVFDTAALFNQVRLHRNLDGSGRLWSNEVAVSAPSAAVFRVSDLDRDGDPDLVFGSDFDLDGDVQPETLAGQAHSRHRLRIGLHGRPGRGR
jgi:hypothetical protein